MRGLYSGTLSLVRFILRRDRVRLSAWVLGIASFTVLCVPLLADMFGTQEELQGMAVLMQNPALTAMVGPVYGLDNFTVGAMYTNSMLVLMAMLTGVMNIFFVTRHTRHDEELGRLEMIKSLPVGCLSNLAATMFVAVKSNILLALLIGFGIAAFGVESMGLSGSLLFGTAMGAAGLVFAAATAVFCQLCSNNRTASGLSLAFLLGAYVLRAVGDVRAETLSLISPLGLVSRAQVYVENYLWPVWILLGAFAVFAVLAFILARARDLGQGVIPARPGAHHGGRTLSSPLGLALRLCRSTLLAWVAVVVIFGVMYGSVINEVDTFIEGSEMLQAMFTAGGGDSQSFTDQFVSLLMMIMAVVAAIPVVSLMLRIWGEEKQGYTEQIYSTGISRIRLFGVYLGTAFAASVVLQFLSILSFWATASITSDTTPSFGVYLQAAMNYLPAMWALLGLTAALVGIAPSKTAISYGYLGFSFFAVYVGTLADLPDWVLGLSPFYHIPRLPEEEQAWAPLAVLTGLSALLMALGFISYRRRDLRSG
ncbi:MAG: ABC transporter permease [Oscillospiraceae bacterium]|nr:ABC transporter permease [Oscillospiraceae bacterium]